LENYANKKKIIVAPLGCAAQLCTFAGLCNSFHGTCFICSCWGPEIDVKTN
jgi:hypothetical protein